MKATKTIFWVAAIFGIVVLVPGFFGESQIQPALSHPEFYYGFHGLALVFQIIFIMIARDPVRYRSLIPIAILEKASFFVPSLVLWSQGRLAVGGPFVGAMIDGLFLLLFILAWWLMRSEGRGQG
ncbi:hypothetical protein SAMN02745824_3074 [Parasphingorhabdus marina DSM 22363]|uniref:Uncharacterized protein n=1 Tax=Parasphingorhabdus marina DSM 22363 TaxID=1123272 RepID=A0A1N6H024_9SPHN|nr:hypothetical protein [Parasphingorhabdus marina]SIO13173.1 hypothetical protein SAMN02745824_3074 [Parasphingorhabdus marina DSM 22363]